MNNSYADLLSPEIVARFYQYTVLCEAQKIVGYLPHLSEGQIDGYVECMSHLFGATPEADLPSTTVYDMIKKITNEMKGMLEQFEGAFAKDMGEELTQQTWKKVRAEVHTFVEKYVIHHYVECVDAIRKI